MAWTAAHGGVEPDAQTLSTLQIMTNASFSDQDRIGFILNSVDGGTSLAVLSYQFFTGKSPTQDGLAYLLGSTANPNGLNDAYYAQFNTENRYINFSANLGVEGEGAAAFAGKYGALSFSDYVASIYETIIGHAYATAAGIDAAKAIADIVSRQDALLATAKSAGMITDGMSQAQIDLALKAAAAGYLLGEAIKADVGLYAAAANNFLLGVIKGDAVYNTDITTTYKPVEGSGSSGTGQPVITPPPPDTVVGYEPPPPPPPEPEPEPDPAPVSQAFSLTTGTDDFTGQGADDTFTGTVGASGTLNAGDKLDGAGGVDTLRAVSGATATFAMSGPTISNIERLQAIVGSGTFTLNMAGAAAFTEVVNSDSAGNIVFQNLEHIAKMAVANVGSGRVTTFNYAAGALTGTADVAELSLTNVTSNATIFLTAASPATNMFETLNIASNGTANAFVLSTDSAQTSLATINITGAAPLTLSVASSTEKVRTVATIDASATTGGVTIGSTSFTLGAADQTIKLGSGDDVVYFGANLTSADTVDGGAGYDVLSVSGSVTSRTALTNVSNIEALRFNMGAGSALTQNASLLAGHGLTELQIDGSSLTSVSLTGIEIGETITLTSSTTKTTLSLGLVGGGSGASDSLTLNFASTSATASVVNKLNGIAGLETLNIVTGGAAAGYTISTNAVTAKQVITGAKPLAMTMDASAAADIDAGAFTGALTVTMASSQSDTIILGAGSDTVNANNGTDTIYLGPANDTSHAYRGADKIYTGSTNARATIVFTDNTETVGGGASTSLAGVVAIASTPTGNGNIGVTPLRFSAGDDHFSINGVHGLSKGSTLAGLNSGDSMVLQSISSTDVATAATTNVSFIGLSTAAAFHTDIKTTFADAIGTSSITGLAAGGAYLVAMYDSTNLRTLVGLVHVGDGDTTLSAADFTDTGVVLIGVFNTASLMTGFSLQTAI
ncbi:hypothetical protein [Caulobacter sp.]|uniref:hypothetical protein n=1 Tax=Caulobacter sp. TaxID=78 RepID=UPI001B1B9CA3|nr:hypothetical protein [Caulobacter sp.]MBO9543517.1 hypothetical protein [Caulobacter sp.]